MRKKSELSLAESLPKKYQPVFETVFMGIIPDVASEQKPIRDPDIRKLLLNFGVPPSYTSGIVIRSYVNDLRRKSLLPICSNNRGYWVARNEKEIQTCIDTLTHRVMGIKAALHGLEVLKKRIS